MKATVLFSATLLSSLLLSTWGTAATIVGGEADYVGDFGAMAAISTSSNLTNSDFEGNWISDDQGGGAWSILSAQGNRDTDDSGNLARGIGIAFNKDGIFADQGTISFDYTLTGENGGTNTKGSAYAFYGISDSSNFTYPDLRDSGETTTNMALLDSFDFPNAPTGGNGTFQTVTGTYTSDPLNLDTATYQGYAFFVFSAAPTAEAGSTIDNVTLTVVPEPSPFVLLLLVAGAGIIMRRRRS